MRYLSSSFESRLELSLSGWYDQHGEVSLWGAANHVRYKGLKSGTPVYIQSNLCWTDFSAGVIQWYRP